MVTAQHLEDCKFCSVFAQASGDDPIGSAPTVDHWLLIERPQPWVPDWLQADAVIQPIVGQLRGLLRRGFRVKLLAIAPDPDYSHPDHIRVFYYRRPARRFTQYEKYEYLLPLDLVTLFLKIALTYIPQAIRYTSASQCSTQMLLRQQEVNLSELNTLGKFASYRQDTDHFREMLVCTHGNVDAACARFGLPLYKALRHEYNSQLRVWRCSHFGGHQYAPTLLDFPDGRCWGHLTVNTLEQLVNRTGAPANLRLYYRGWAGLSKFEQIAERDIWMADNGDGEGWQWLTHPKTGRVIKRQASLLQQIVWFVLQRIPVFPLHRWVQRSQQDAQWTKVRIEFDSPTSGSSYYEATVEAKGQTMTAIHSRSGSSSGAQPMTLVPINRYQVRHLSDCRHSDDRHSTDLHLD